MRLKGAGIQVSKYSNPATLAAFLVEFMSLPCLSKALWGLSILRLSRHALQRFRRMLQGGVELERRLVGLLRLRLSPFLLVNRAEVVVRVGERRLVLRRRVGDVLLVRQVELLLLRIDERIGAVAHDRIDRFDLPGLLECLLVRAAHDAGRARVDLDEAKACLDVLWIECDRVLELVFDSRRVLGGAQHAARLHLGAVRAAEIEMRPGALRRLRDGLLQDVDGGVAIAAADCGASLLDQRRLPEERDGGQRRENREWEARMSYEGDSHLLHLCTGLVQLNQTSSR